MLGTADLDNQGVVFVALQIQVANSKVAVLAFTNA